MNKNPVPDKYPYVVFLRKKEFQYIDNILNNSKDKLCFSYRIIDFILNNDNSINESIFKELNCLFSEEFNIIITISDNWEDYKDIQKNFIYKINKKWLHLNPNIFNNLDFLNSNVLNCFINNLPNRNLFRPKISCFSTCFNSFDKLYRPFFSLLKQNYLNWEWVIIDDSKDDSNFEFIRNNISSKDHRIRAYRKDFHSGNIGNVKNEAVSLCRGEIVLELDHDDEILNDTLFEIVKAFDENSDVGFVYMNFAECYEDKRPFRYDDKWGMGYGGYYKQIYENNLYEVAVSCDINDISMSNIVGVPNHPRAWRKSVLMEIGNYSEALPVADDYELLLLTCLKTKMMKINKFGYIQYKNNSNNNFSLIRNWEINKLQSNISKIYYEKFKINDFFAQNGIQESKNKEDKHINLIKY